MKKTAIAFGVFAFASMLILGVMMTFVTAEPNGASVNEVRSESTPNGTAGNHAAFAGNVTELTLTGDSNTQAWQGYFGNVTGSLRLGDASGNVLYNWSLADPEGEVYASTNVSINWTEVQCFNFTAVGNHTTLGETAGATNLYGTNAVQLEAQYGIASGDADGLNDTFSTANTHDAFFTGSLAFSAGECQSTLLFDSTGQGVADSFEEALLYEPTTSSVIFAAILESGSVNGFDGNDYDFEMLVLEDGHSGDTSTTTYYFFTELE